MCEDLKILIQSDPDPEDNPAHQGAAGHGERAVHEGDTVHTLSTFYNPAGNLFDDGRMGIFLSFYIFYSLVSMLRF